VLGWEEVGKKYDQAYIFADTCTHAPFSTWITMTDTTLLTFSTAAASIGVHGITFAHTTQLIGQCKKCRAVRRHRAGV
jgi:hypothetical protein